MTRCPNCNYFVVLLPKRRKYKCARCSRLWIQKLIDNREFKKWNTWQREITKTQVDSELQQRKSRKKLTKEEKRQRIKAYYLKNRDKILEINRNWRRNNIDYDKKRHQQYYLKNKVLLKFKAEQYQLRNKEKVKERKHQYRLQRREYFNALDRARYYRNWEKIRNYQNTRNKLKRALAHMGLQNSEEKPSKARIDMPNAHYSLCELLIDSSSQSKIFKV